MKTVKRLVSLFALALSSIAIPALAAECNGPYVTTPAYYCPQVKWSYLWFVDGQAPFLNATAMWGGYYSDINTNITIGPTLSEPVKISISNTTSGTSSTLAINVNSGILSIKEAASNNAWWEINANSFMLYNPAIAKSFYINWGTANGVILGYSTATATEAMYVNETNGHIWVGIGASAPSGDYYLETSGNTKVGGNLDVSVNTNVGGNLTVTGYASVGNNLDVGGNLAVSGSASVTGNANVGGTLTANSVSVSNDVNVGGNILLTGQLNTTNTATFNLTNQLGGTEGYVQITTYNDGTGTYPAIKICYNGSCGIIYFNGTALIQTVP